MPKSAAQATKTTKSIYGVHPGVEMTQRWIAQLKEKTGRTLEEWLKYIKKEGPPTEKERRDWLKNELGMGTNSAWWLAERSVGKGEEVGDPDEYLKAAEMYVETMFAGKKAHLAKRVWLCPGALCEICRFRVASLNLDNIFSYCVPPTVEFQAIFAGAE